jgi:hypothetical protein
MANSKQRLLIRRAEEQGRATPKVFIPAGKATLGLIGGLMICSVIYHTQLKLPY